MCREALFAPHRTRTIERIKSETSEYILAIQDSTYLNYTTHKAKTELGRIGGTRHQKQYGLIQHSTLCVTDQNEPLGLIDLQLFHHDDRDTSIACNERKLEDKQSDCWLKGLRVIQEELGNRNQTLVTIADREGDFFEFLKALHDDQQSFVIRAKYDRYTGKKHRHQGEKLFSRVARSNVIGHMQVTISEAGTREVKNIDLQLKCASHVLLPKVYRGPGSISKDDLPISVNVVMAYDDDHRWILLTNLPVTTEQDVKRVIEFYRCRWHIEDYHKILKTAYQVEQIYLHASRQAVENALTLAALSACRFYWMLYVGRAEQSREASDLFAEHEWKALYIYFKELPPTHAPPIADVICRIARLGGYKQRKNDKPPGIKTLWHGLQLFTAITAMYHNSLSIIT